MGSRLGSPFSGSDAMAEAYNHASYLRLRMGLTFDTATGDISCQKDGYSGGEPVTGSPGEVLVTPSIQDCLLVKASREGLSNEARMINVAFMLGALSAEVES